MSAPYHRFDGYEELKVLLEGSDEDVLVAIDYLDSATTNIEGLSEAILVTEPISPSLFIEGTNVVAVEIHAVRG